MNIQVSKSSCLVPVTAVRPRILIFLRVNFVCHDHGALHAAVYLHFILPLMPGKNHLISRHRHGPREDVTMIYQTLSITPCYTLPHIRCGKSSNGVFFPQLTWRCITKCYAVLEVFYFRYDGALLSPSRRGVSRGEPHEGRALGKTCIWRAHSPIHIPNRRFARAQPWQPTGHGGAGLSGLWGYERETRGRASGKNKRVKGVGLPPPPSR